MCVVGKILVLYAVLYSEEECFKSASIDIEDSSRKRRMVASEEKEKIIVSKVCAC